MTTDDAFDHIATAQPLLVYVAGKTSTGKTTFSKRLRDELGYGIIELDALVVDDVMPAFGLHDRGAAFQKVYKFRDRLDVVRAFVAAAHQRIASQLAAGQPTVVEGAIVHVDTIFDVFGSYPDLLYLYLHPQRLDTYIRNLTGRFVTANEVSEAGLPVGFWDIMGKERLAAFCKTRTLTPAMAEAIEEYARKGQESSLKRLAASRQRFPHLKVVAV